MGGNGGGPSQGPGPRGFSGRAPLVPSAAMNPSGSGAPGGGSVLMVYELDPEKVNPDKVFNLFCLYGNVAKIKFLKTKGKKKKYHACDSLRRNDKFNYFFNTIETYSDLS